MTNLNGPSTHLSWAELACHNGTPYPQQFVEDGRLEVLATTFETIRTKLGGKPLLVLSAYREEKYNRLIGGAKNSQHVQGRAIDLRTPKGMTNRELFDILVGLVPTTAIRGIGLYRWGCHFDIRPQQKLSLWKDNGIGEI